jgi:hypothetical protein
MDRDEALRLLKGGEERIEEWNRRRKLSESIPELDRADLARADLATADLGRANLTGANLSGANLGRAKLAVANLSGANLSGANLSGANVEGASLAGADLTGADLGRANLTGADLAGADLAEVMCWTTVFADNDLSAVRGLDSIDHVAPSSIGTDTLFRSKGKIPEAFLRGCGLPDSLIEYLPSLIGSMSPIEFYSCFISYSSRNQEFADRLHADLQAKGVRCWFDRDDLKIGDKIRHRITEAIRVHDKLMLVLSEQSINSDWVEGEVEAALERERREKRTVLFPFRLDDAVMLVLDTTKLHLPLLQ